MNNGTPVCTGILPGPEQQSEVKSYFSTQRIVELERILKVVQFYSLLFLPNSQA